MNFRNYKVFLNLFLILILSVHIANSQVSFSPRSGYNDIGDLFSLTIGLSNDNLTQTDTMDLNAMFGGPDDNFTCTGFMLLNYYPWSIQIDYNMLTFKKTGTRSDLLGMIIKYTWCNDWLIYEIGGGISLNSNFGGQIIQNIIHEMGDWPNFSLDYNESSYGYLIKAGISGKIISFYDNSLVLDSFSDFTQYGGTGINRIIAGIRLRIFTWIMDGELAIGRSVYFDVPELFSDFLGSGTLFRLQVSAKLGESFNFTAGLSQNIVEFTASGSDFSEYENYHGATTVNEKFRLPQFYFMLTFGGKTPSSRILPVP